MVHCIGRGFHESHVRAICHTVFLSYTGSVYTKVASYLLTDIPTVAFWQDQYERFTSFRHWYYYYSASNLIKMVTFNNDSSTSVICDCE
jgi:hypothetical protein